MTKKSPDKGFLVYIPLYQHAYLKMVAGRDGTKMVSIIRRLLDEEIRKEYPVVEYETRREELTRELEVVELMIQESSYMKDHQEWVQGELERIVPPLAGGSDPTPELADYVSARLGLSWQDLWSVVEQYRETGRVEV